MTNTTLFVIVRLAVILSCVSKEPDKPAFLFILSMYIHYRQTELQEYTMMKETRYAC